METKIYPPKWGDTIYVLTNYDLYNSELVPSYRKIENVSYVLKTFEDANNSIVEIRTPNEVINCVYESDLEELSIDNWLASTEEIAQKLLRQNIYNMLSIHNAQLKDLISSVKGKRQLIAKLNKALKQLNNNKL